MSNLKASTELTPPAEMEPPPGEALSAEALAQQGLVCLKEDHFDAAVKHLLAAVHVQPDSAEICHNLAVAYARAGKLEEAIGQFRRALDLKPGSADAYGNLGLAYLDSGKPDEALPCYREVTRLRPEWPQGHFQLGNVLRRLGQPGEAVECYRSALKFKPDFAEAHHNIGLAYAQQGKYAEAAASYREAIRVKTDYASAYNNLGIALQELNKLDEAVATFHEALKHKPDAHETHSNLGVALAAQGKLEEAVTSYQEALRLKPDYAEAHNNLGNALRDLGTLDKAVHHFQEALRLKPDYSETYNNLGIARLQQGSIDDAIACYDRALELNPDYPDARKNRSLARLAQGDWLRAWPEYEWRWHSKGIAPRSFRQPRWDGGLLDGKTILLYAEQGLGDTLQFIRYAALVKERGARTLFECPKVLMRLLTRMDGVDEVIPEGTPLPDFDVQSPLLSLPGMFGTTPEAIPAGVPYLAADPERTARWREALRRIAGFKIGIVWQGNPGFKNDRNRSIPLSQFARLADIQGVQLVSLQKGHGTDQIRSWRSDLPLTVLDPDLEAAGRDFADTAAIMMNLDLVITADTATAHLAGALGVPVWVGLPVISDWRWLRDRTDTPWYPTMCLYRQERWGDWETVFARMAAELRRQVGADRRSERLNLSQAQSVERLHNGGVALAQVGKLAEAADHFRQALALNPMSVPTLDNLGLALLNLGQPGPAAEAFREALHWQPDAVEVCNNLGVALLRLDRVDEAIIQYERALALKPDYAEAHNNLGNVFRDRGQFKDAIACYWRAMHARRDFAEAHNNLGIAYARQNQHEKAAASYGAAIKHKPDYAKAHANLAVALERLRKPEDAIRSYEEALRLDAREPDWHNRLGNLLRACGRLAHAEQSYQQALRLRPEWADARNNLGISLAQQGRFEEAIAEYQEAIRIDVGFAKAYGNLAISLANLDRTDAALSNYAEALRLDPSHAETHRNYGLSLLALGQLEEGWSENEWRWRCEDAPARRSRAPQWDGSPLRGKTILLHPEQGIGDAFQFVRYARLVQERGGKVLLECPRGLITLLRSCPGVHGSIAHDEPLPAHDLQASLMSLPGIFETTLATIPASVPYLSAPADVIGHWQRALRHIHGFKVGIAWQGSPNYRGDRYRSIPLKHFAPLAALEGVQLISLQKGNGTEQLSKLGRRFSVLEFERQVDEDGESFLDTAGLMKSLDLVVTSDTAIAHLAGALGVPVWLALGFPSDWRWLRGRADSPWYPTMRVFRQPTPGAWDEVFTRMAGEIEQLLQRREDSPSSHSASPTCEPEHVHAAASMSLDLLKRCLTNWIYGEHELVEVSADERISPEVGRLIADRGLVLAKAGTFDPAKRADGSDWPPYAHTMVGLKRLDNLQECLEDVLRNNVIGDVIETGTWRGGAAIFMRGVLKAHNVSDRVVWVADSFAGLPIPNAEKYPADRDEVLHANPYLAVSLEQVKANFERYGLLDEQVRFLKGWFKDTLPQAPVERLALLRLDGDYYESTMDALVHLYPKLSLGGFVIVDDYGAVSGCKQAVLDYRQAQCISEAIASIDWGGVYWKKMR